MMTMRRLWITRAVGALSWAVQKGINGLSQNVSLVATLNISSLRFKLRPEGGQWQCRSRNRIRKIYRWPPSTSLSPRTPPCSWLRMPKTPPVPGNPCPGSLSGWCMRTMRLPSATMGAWRWGIVGEKIIRVRNIQIVINEINIFLRFWWKVSLSTACLPCMSTRCR